MKTKGFTLIEVLVSLVILALGFVWLSSLQIHSMKTNQSAMQRSQAIMLAEYMMESMRANKLTALAGYYDFGSSAVSDEPVCTIPQETDLVSGDQAAWMTALKETLGDLDTTCGLIACSATDCMVKVYWDDQRAGGTDEEYVEVSGRL